MTTKLKINCPSCDQKLRVSEQKLTLQVCCPKCKQRFVPQTAANTTRSGDGLQQTIISNDRVSGMLSSPTESRKTIGRFLIKDKLGEGAFGAVYKAHDLQLERTVAIKVPTFATGDLRRRRRFVTEARSAAKLHHPNIITVYENGETEDGQLYIASEFVAGKTLKVVLKNSESVLTQRVTWVRDLAEALHYAHSEGIVHRDIKPENVLIDDTSTRAKVADFGLAKVLDEQGSSEKAELKTQDGILGTPAFMAPEQARGKLSEVGPHSDQYSLGAVLYQCLTGQPPFFGSTYVVVAAVAGDTEPISIRNISPSVPHDLVAICDKAMSKSVKWRYKACEDLAHDLDRWLSGEPVTARPLSPPARTMMMIRRHPVPAATSALAAALLIAIAVLAFLSRQRAIDDKERFDHERMAAIEAKDAATAAEKKTLDLNRQLVQKTEEANTRTKQAQAAQKSAEELAEKLQNQISITTQLKTDLTLSTEENSLLAAIESATAYASKLASARESINSGHFEKARETLETTPERQRHVEYKVLMAMARPVVPLFHTSSLSSGSESQLGNFAFSNDYSKVGFVTSDMSLHYSRRGKIASLALSDDMGLSSEDFRSCRMAFSYDGRWLVMRARENRRDAIKKAWVCDTDAAKPTLTTIDFESMRKSRLGEVWNSPDESITVASGISPLVITPKLGDRTTRHRQSTYLTSSYDDEWAVNGEIAEGSLTRSQIRDGVVPSFARRGRASISIIGHADGSVILMDRNMKVLSSFHDFKEPITFAAFGGDMVAVAGGRDLVVRNTDTGESSFQHRRLASYLAYVQFLTCPTDPRRTDAILAATSDGQLLQIDIESQRFRRMLERDLTSTDADAVGKSRVGNDSRIGFDPSEKHALAVGENHSVILNTGSENNTPVNTTTFLGHTDEVYSGAISPDLRRAVTSSADRTIRIWDVRTGIELLSLPMGYTRSRRPEPQGMSINESKIELLLTASKTRTLSREEVLRLPDAAENANYRVSSHTVVQWGDFRQEIVPEALTHLD